MAKRPGTKKTVETIKHDMDNRKNIPTAEFQAGVQPEKLVQTSDVGLLIRGLF
jgi:hypothetical protein